MAAFFCPVLKIILEMNDITPFMVLFPDISYPISNRSLLQPVESTSPAQP